MRHLGFRSHGQGSDPHNSQAYLYVVLRRFHNFHYSTAILNSHSVIVATDPIRLIFTGIAPHAAISVVPIVLFVLREYGPRHQE